jgi:hypothetical protein
MAEPSILQRLGELNSEIPSADKMTAKGLAHKLAPVGGYLKPILCTHGPWRFGSSDLVKSHHDQ